MREFLHLQRELYLLETMLGERNITIDLESTSLEEVLPNISLCISDARQQSKLSGFQ